MFSHEWQGLTPGVRQIITAHHLDVPVKVGQVAKKLGLAVQAATLAPGISGEIRPASEGAYVVKVNRHDSSGRQRFTVAHEIAHYLLHRAHIGNGITDDVLYRSNLSDVREAEANRLAADILMPPQLVARERGQLDGLTPEELAQRMSEIFGVSKVAMKIRLGIR